MSNQVPPVKSVKNKNIRVTSSNQKLNSKIKLDVNDTADKVSWYIKFNTQLDPTSVSEKTMMVTETNGYILDTDITYDAVKHVIAITPLDYYEQNEFYILTISKRVKSAGGNNMKRETYLLFKLTDGQISQFEVLKSTAKVPKPIKKPKSLKIKQAEERARTSHIKAYSFDESILKKVPKHKLPYGRIGLNIFIALAGILAFIASIFINNIISTSIALFLCVVGLAHIIFQLTKGRVRSAIFYNIGVVSFNDGRYKSAEKSFMKAHLLDPDNELAEYAMHKVVFYLD